MSHC